MVEPASQEARARGAALRAGAALVAVALPVVWLLTLTADPAMVRTNLFRVLGGALGAGVGWLLNHQRGTEASWGSYLAGGIAGSLVVSGLSIALPALGRAAMSGWLMSGVVGGGVVALLVYAFRGRLGGRRREHDPRHA